ncbi:MAG TPA: thiamine pyrophosphate-binding protein [Candidatus Limnocylindrales bacterium]|nr:thiamine pyrophosphate-binding protein [Candidatus Limnocylindrales bacterium]
MRSTAADHIARFLVDRGVEQVFGLCGHTNISVLAAFERLGAPRFITTRHEQVAAHAADGYARATGRPGVVLLHVGPGMTNAATGVATAAFDSIPLVVIAGDVPSYYEGRGPHQEFNLRRDADQVSVYEPFVKRAWRVRRSDQLPRVLARAWDTALAGRPGPVLVSVPMDILAEALDADVVPASPVAAPTISGSTAAAIAGELRAAARPLLLAGGGTRRAAAEVRRLAELTGMPVAHSLMGTGVLPPDHPQLLGIVGFWGSPTANRLASEADVILAVGTRFPETDSSSWEDGVTFGIPPTRLIHIDIDPNEPGRNYPTTLAATADAGLALEAIAAAYGDATPDRGQDWNLLRAEREAFLAPSRDNARSDEFPLLPERILADVRRAAPNAILVTDVGWNKNGVAQQYPVDSPDSFLTPGGFSTMGFGPAAVLGVVTARPGRPVIALVGDGAFGSNPSVIATAVEMGIAPVWVVMNNAAFGTIAGLQRKHYGTGFGCEFQCEGSAYSPDFAAIARACGADGISIERADQLEAALREACASGRPTVIDVPMRNTPVMTPGEWDIERIYQAAQ